MDYSILETLIKRARRAPKDLDLLYWALMRLDLMVLGKVAGPGEAAPGAVHRTLHKGQELDLYFFEGEDGRRMLPAYTSEAVMRQGLGGDPESLQLAVRLLLRMLDPADSLVINPGTDCALDLGSLQIQGLLKGLLGRGRKGVSRLLLGPPQAAPWLVLRGLKDYFRSCPLVDCAYLGERLEEEKGRLEKVLEVGVVMQKGQEEEFVTELAPEMKALATRFRDTRLAFCLVTGRLRAEYRALKVSPFYQKGLFRRVRKIRVYVPAKFEAKA